MSLCAVLMVFFGNFRLLFSRLKRVWVEFAGLQPLLLEDMPASPSISLPEYPPDQGRPGVGWRISYALKGISKPIFKFKTVFRARL